MADNIDEQIEVTKRYLDYMMGVASSRPGSGIEAFTARCCRFGEVMIVPGEECGEFRFFGHDSDPAAALGIALASYRAALVEWKERGERSRELACAASALAARVRGTPISVETKYETRSNLVNGFNIAAHWLTRKQARAFGGTALARLGALSVNMDARRRLVSADFDGLGDAERFVDFLLGFCDEEKCESCQGTGYCTSCDGEGCGECEGQPECSECLGGAIMVWRES